MASSLRRGLFEAEDLLLALWTIGFERLASRAFGADPSSWLETGQGAFTPLAWVVLAGFLFMLLTEHDPQIGGEEATNRRVLACGPLFFLPGMAIGLANAFRKKDDWPGPRVAAGATVHPGPWILRFASYFVALASSSLIVNRTLTT